ncbi:MAG: hypothetical protein PHS95_00800 [Candidatus Pacebacteria bacterium]|nr:hypothetical protein [Candidatus Paceibacterota bacterium]
MIRKIIIVIAVVAVAGLGVFYYLNKGSTAPSVANTGSFGNNTSTAVDNNSDATTTEIAIPTQPAFVPSSGQPFPRLYELHREPTAGVAFVESGSGKKYVASARYIERGVGNIFDTDLSTYVESRVVNETRSRLSEALWGQNGKSVVVRSLVGSTIKTSILNLSNPTKLLAPDGTKNFMKVEEISLPDSIPFMATAEDGTNKLFYLKNNKDGAQGTTITYKNTSATKIFTSLFTEWLPQFPNQNTVALTTKASANIPGGLFFLDTRTRSFNKIIGSINGLTTLVSPDNKRVLYSETKDGSPQLSVYNIATKEKRDLSIQTLAEKCVWGRKQTTVVYCAVPKTIPAGAYPDAWYQGIVSLADSIWKIDTQNTDTEELTSSTDLNGVNLDMTNLSLNSNDSYLLFTNKITGTPWVFRVSK